MSVYVCVCLCMHVRCWCVRNTERELTKTWLNNNNKLNHHQQIWLQAFKLKLFPKLKIFLETLIITCFGKTSNIKNISLKVPVLDNLAFGKNKTQFCVKYIKSCYVGLFYPFST